MDGSELAQRYAAYLDAEGFRPTIDEVGDVQFKFEGKTYVIDVDADDEAFFRVFVPCILHMDGDKERALALAAAGCATARTKVAKIILVDDYVWASLETFVPSMDALRAVFLRHLRALQAAMHHFAECLRDCGTDEARTVDVVIAGPAIQA